VDLLSNQTHALLSRVSTATLTTQLFKRGFHNVFLHGVKALHKSMNRNLVGPAFTLRNIPSREDIDVIGIFQDPNHPQRRAIETAPPGSVIVQDCRGEMEAACCGAILATRMKVRGIAGMVADGPVRDSGVITSLGLPFFCRGASAPTNLIKHHATDMNLPIGCAGVPVYPGDIVVGDVDGVVVIPYQLADEVAVAAGEQEDLEAFIIQKVEAGAPLPGTYPPSEQVMNEYRATKAKENLADTNS
jgi:regulator of RNase E activity RraA